ncbi:uncharacterized protein C2845_PM07G28110 [Panicum miliaceum]|uniref:Uncharacterized protein n=1 Tax=Panicum miliaceum TaxID=4540 RepID=A0A3L6SJ21_PANMI|nr:uncharacterized protein C2845_PM07G28110 [Panicum miliaceum]
MAHEVRLSNLSCDPNFYRFLLRIGHASLWLSAGVGWGVRQDGWPLGLGALSARAGELRGVDLILSGSPSFSTTFTSSHSASSLPSTDFDTESSWSLSRGGGGGGGMTLASLIGLVDAMESRRRPSARAGRSGRLRALLLSLCLRSHLENGRGAPSLREFLEMERRASGAPSDAHGL